MIAAAPDQSVVLLNRQRRHPVNTRWLRAVARAALPHCLAVSDDGQHALAALPEIVVALVSDAAIAQLHVRFMGIEGPTDVLTFEHGEIVMSVETALLYAQQYGHPVEQELALYTIHGFLHLNGYDDTSAAPAARMRRTQNRILEKVLREIPLP